MCRFLLPLMAILLSVRLSAQNSFRAITKSGTDSSILKGVSVTIKGQNIKSLSDTNGLVFLKNIPNGKHTIIFSHIGYETLEIDDNFPLADSLQNLLLYLQPEEEELNQVVVQSTRTSRTIRNTPTRVELIDDEELDEKANMQPGNVSMILQESTGLQVQQTSATSGNASIRVQGLDGRYTQLLKDGYPNFGNFASGLSLLEIPPLDLKQVEVIKGSASTLYGGGAIAGVINFVSKLPKEDAEYSANINQSSIGQSNIGIYASHRSKNFGYTVLGLANFSKAYDVDGDGFSEVPKSSGYSINTKLFYYPNSNTSLMLGNSLTFGNMIGGDMQVINGNADANHVYFEKNKTVRNTTTFEIEKKVRDKNNFKIKQSLGYFDRIINLPNYVFAGLNTNVFTDISYVWNSNGQTLIAGLNLLYDNFKQRDISILDSKSLTVGAYVQHTWDVTEKIKLENGIRLDHADYSNNNFSKDRYFVLPRISAMFNINNHWSSRIGGGLGYKMPTIFTEQTETIQYRNIMPLGNVTTEHSIGGTADVNFKTGNANSFLFTINQLFFLTRINEPLVLKSNGTDSFFVNAAQPVTSKGFETNIKMVFRNHIKFFMGYTYTDATAGYLLGNRFLPLLPKNKLNLALIYEKEKDIKVGLEGYFTDHQFLYDGTKTPSFWEFGMMGEKYLSKWVSIFINFENINNVRQSRYKTVVNPPHNNPTFDDIWTQTEGFVMNGGLKIKI